jgi:hypothetical protein
LLQRLMPVNLTEDLDIFVWKLNTLGTFSVKSIYVDIMNAHTVFLRKYIWKIKVPLKIKIFMWFLYKKLILTEDNLAKRKWNGCKNVCSVTQRSLSTIYFSLVPSLDLYGGLLSLLSIYPLLLMLQICLEIG